MQTARGSLDLSSHPAADAMMPPNLASAAEENFGAEPVVPIGEVKAELEFADTETELPPPPPLPEIVFDAPSLLPSVDHEKVPDAVVGESGTEDVESDTGAPASSAPASIWSSAAGWLHRLRAPAP
jgi:hypothetical protein